MPSRTRRTTVRSSENALFIMPRDIQSRCQNFENLTGAKGGGGRENRGAKGHYFDTLAAGKTMTVFQAEGSGVITRMWLTFSGGAGNLSPRVLRGVRLDMYWDDCETPAVSCPLGDFFGIGLGRGGVSYENEFFSCPFGRCFNGYIPMPFLRSARITVTNDTGMDLTHVVPSFEYCLRPLDPKETLYFHAAWRREIETTLQRDFEILPRVEGRGRYLGATLSVIANPRYKKTWWGEGEAKIFLDGDGEYPTVIGTGSEDYAGSAWGLDFFSHRYQGALVTDAGRGEFSFYRFHVPDGVFFYKDIRVTMQQMGGAPKKVLLDLARKGVPVVITGVNTRATPRRFIKAFEQGMTVQDDRLQPDDWCNFYRTDDWAACAYFYLDRPENGLPPLATAETRLAKVGPPTDPQANATTGFAAQ